MHLTPPDTSCGGSSSPSINNVEYGVLAPPNGGGSSTLGEPAAVLPKFIYPRAPSNTQRYDYKRTVEDKSPARMIPPLTVSFQDSRSTLPPGWVQHIHPEGLPYFVLSFPAGGHMQRVVTEEWMYDRQICALVDYFIKQIQDAISDHKLSIFSDSDLFIELHRTEGELTEEGGGPHCGYYFVHHPTRCIYWLEKVKLSPVTSKFLNSVLGKLSVYQSKLCLETEYWVHFNNFPDLHDVTTDIYDEVVDAIVGVMTDVISAPQHASTSFTYESLRRMLKVIRVAKDCKTSNWHIGRFMVELLRDRLRNYYGSWGTRMDKDQSVIKDRKDQHSMIMDIVSPFLFFIPHALLERAETLMVDRRFMLREWEIYFEDIKDEWNQTAILATIILTANCAFLAIPIFQDPDLATHSSAEQIASYLSLTTSLFGLVIALVMYRHHKSRRGSSPSEILAHIHGKYVERVKNVHWERLFLIWSLPHALVMWSAIAFAVAFLLMCFLGTATSAKVTISVCTSLLGSFTCYYVVNFGSGKQLLRIWFGRILRRIENMRKAIRQKRKESQMGLSPLSS